MKICYLDEGMSPTSLKLSAMDKMTFMYRDDQTSSLCFKYTLTKPFWRTTQPRWKLNYRLIRALRYQIAIARLSSQGSYLQDAYSAETDKLIR